jgi:K+-transporting ATPase KdpF subunit
MFGRDLRVCGKLLMTFQMILAGLTAFGLLVYLLAVLARPERF